MNPHNITRHALTDWIPKNKLTTCLPAGVGESNGASDRILIMVSISDAIGAVTNVTQSLVVTPKSQQSEDLNNYLSTLKEFADTNNDSLSIAQEASL